MKVKELIEILEGANPEAFVELCIETGILDGDGSWYGTEESRLSYVQPAEEFLHQADYVYLNG